MSPTSSVNTAPAPSDEGSVDQRSELMRHILDSATLSVIRSEKGDISSATKETLLGQVERSVAAVHGAYMLAGYSEGESRKESWLACLLSCKTQLSSGGTDMTDEAEQNTQMQVRNLLISARWYQCVDETRRYLAWERSRVGARPTVTGPNYVTSYCHWVWDQLNEQEKEEAIKYGEEEAKKAGLQPEQLYNKVHSEAEVSDVELQLYYLGLPLITMRREGRREDYQKYCVDTRDLRYTRRARKSAGAL